MNINKKLHEYKYKRWAVLGLGILIFAMMLLFQNAAFALRTLTAVGFIVLFYIIDHFFDIEFKPIHYVFIIIIAVSSLLLSPLYFIYPSYDKIQHFIQPMFIFSIVFYMVSKLKLAFKWQLAFTFFVTASILGIFEIGEFLLDLLFDLKLQGVYLRDVKGIEKLNLIVEPNFDTMIDLSLGLLGSLAYAISFGLYSTKKRKLKRDRA